VSSAAGPLAAEEVDPQALADAVLAVPGVVGLSGGPLGTVASYLPGRRVAGVAVRDDGVEVHVVGRLGDDLPAVAARVQAAARALASGRPVDVRVDDVTGPTPPAASAGTPALPAAAGGTEPALPGPDPAAPALPAGG